MRSDVVAVSRQVVPAALLRLASDERLVAYVRVGSEQAFEAIFERHHRAVLAFCRRMLGSSADAEDAVQHTFLAAYRDLLRSDKPIVLRPWLYTIARHRCVSMLRERRTRPAAELLEPASDHLTVEVAAREELRTTLTDIARLPEDQRTALILAELSDVSYEEIARILGCRHDKVKALVFQARSSLSADREARETPCADIREQLSTRGGVLRQATMRRHVRECDGCRRFRDEIRMRRRHLRVFLPLVPWLGFKRASVGAMSGWGGAGAGGAGMTAGALGGGGCAVALVVAAVASGGGAVSTTAGEHRAPSMRQLPATTTTMQEKVTGAVERSPRTQRVAVVRRGDRMAARARETIGREAAPVVPQGEHRAPAPAPAADLETRTSTAKPHEVPPVPDPVKERPAERHRAAPHRPTRPPVVNGQRRPDVPVRSNGHPKPARAAHPEPPRKAAPAPAKGPGKPPSAPSPAAPSPPSPATPAAPAAAAPAAPEPSPPANSNAGGSGNRSDEAKGHRGERPRP